MTENTSVKDEKNWLSAVLMGFVPMLLIGIWLTLNLQSYMLVDNADITLLTGAEGVPSSVSIDEIQSSGEAQWVSVSFPFHWRNQFADARSVWYRMTFSLAESPDASSLWALYIWRLNQTADIWLNGAMIGSGGQTGSVRESDGAIARYWNSPLYFEFPASLLASENELLIRHYAENNWGSMEPVMMAPANVLAPLYKQRYFIQHDVAMGLLVFVVITGLFTLTVWWYRRSEVQYLWFAIASVALSVYCLNQFIRYLPVSPENWRWLLNVSIDVWAYSLAMFIFHTLRIRRAWFQRLGMFFVISGVPLYFIASHYQLFDINIYYHIGSLIIGVYILVECIRHFYMTKSALAALYVVLIALLFMAGLHDLIMQAVLNIGWFQSDNSAFLNHFNSLHFAAPLIFMFIGASLIKQFIEAMNTSDRLNVQLESRVREARKELEANYRQMEMVLMKQSASEERERIYRDLHDDVGSKLLSLYYRLEKESDSTLAKSALEDLRDIVSSKTLEQCSLKEALEQWQTEISDRVNDAGGVLQWESGHIDATLMLGEKQYTQLRRILREVLSNALLHSESNGEIRLSVSARLGDLVFKVINGGVAHPVNEWQPGRGISNLKVRTRDLGGQLDIYDLEKGFVCVEWHVPVDTDAGVSA